MSDVINKFSVGFNESKSSIPVLFESGSSGHGGSGGDGNYEHLQRKPRINDVELVGNKTGADLGLVDSTTTDAILSMITGVEKSTIATKDYAEHDLVIVENKLYEITDEIISGSQFVIGTNCKVTTISEQTVGLYEQIVVNGQSVTELSNRFDEMTIQGFKRGKVSVPGIIKQNYMYDRRGYEQALNKWSYLTITCQPDTAYSISGTASTSARLYTVLDSNGNVIDLAEPDTTVRKENIEYITPVNAVTLIVNASNNQGAPSVKKQGDNFIPIDTEDNSIGTETSENVYVVSGGDFSTVVELYGTPNKTMNIGVINYAGSTFKTTDDVCPVNFLDAAYVGSNHGFYYGFNLTISAHGLSAANIGSIYHDSRTNYRWLLLSIVDSNTVLACTTSTTKWYGMGNPAASDYPTLIDFGTGLLTVVSCTKTQIYPSVQNVSISIAENNAQQFIVDEQYSIIDPATGLEYIQNHVGSNNNTSFCDHANALLDLYNRYVFDTRGNCVVMSNLIADKAARLNFFGGTQSKAFGSSDQFCVLGTTYGTLTAISDRAIYFSKSTWNNENEPPICYIQANGTKTAYTKLFVSVILANERKQNIADNAGFVHTTRKMYPFTVEPSTEIPVGTGYGMTVLRMPINVGSAQQSMAYCRAGRKWYVFMAMREAGRYRFDVPEVLNGLSVNVIAYSNCSLATDVAVCEFNVVAANEAYILLELN